MKKWLLNILQSMEDIYQILKEIKALYHQFTIVTAHLQTIIQLIENYNQLAEEREKTVDTAQHQHEIKLLDIGQVMKILNISESTYYRWVENGELQPRKKGKRHYYYLFDLHDQIAKSRLKGRL
ncbi:helix-turn-helix domain-containing protein [Sphingobacterium faecium]|uniref:helix-turn-helix domain-containing protein n=1 Tax=Sphingobacterium faecium TaxID=34087 RepID=UPI003DA62FFA